jgi:competence protein ComGC
MTTPPVLENRAKPTNQSGLAIVSLLLGILSLLGCLVLTAIPAVICGHVAWGRIKRSGGSLGGEGLAMAGLIMGYVGVALTLVVALLSLIAIPNFIKARQTAQKNACVNNLRQLDGAVQMFALENKKKPTDRVTLEDCQPYLKSQLICPAGGTSTADSYQVTDCQSPPVCIAPQGGKASGHQLTLP